MSLLQESWLMKLARNIGWDKGGWAIRRFYCPVGKSALVLEVGSGGNPYARSNVLLDAYEVTRERHWAPLVSDRPTVLGFVENLPFKDKAFDFVIASHVLEHSSDPVRFLSELQRVAKAGYIETPDAFMERINPYKDHRLEVTVRNHRLLIRKKAAWQVDTELVELYEHKAKEWTTQELIPDHPFDFHVRYYWSDEINFVVINPEIDAAWQAPVEQSNTHQGTSIKPTVRQKIRHGLRGLLSQKKRNKTINLLSLLQCPRCNCQSLTQHENDLTCVSCEQQYKVVNGVPSLMVGHAV